MPPVFKTGESRVSPGSGRFDSDTLPPNVQLFDRTLILALSSPHPSLKACERVGHPAMRVLAASIDRLGCTSTQKRSPAFCSVTAAFRERLVQPGNALATSFANNSLRNLGFCSCSLRPLWGRSIWSGDEF
jgi:hypothetical protein